MILFTLGTYDPAPGVSIGLPTPAAAGLLFTFAFGVSLEPQMLTWLVLALAAAMHVPLRVWKPSLGKEGKNDKSA